MSEYPASVKNFLSLDDGIDDIVAQHPNNRGDEITAIQTLIGAMGSSQSYLLTLKELFKNYRRACWVDAKSTTELYVRAGEIAIPNVSTGMRWRANPSDTTVTWAMLDTGAEAASTRYYVYAVADASGTTFTVMISASATTPTGATYYKKIGSFYNDSSSNITDVMCDLRLERKITGSVEKWFTDTPPGGALLLDGSAHDASNDETLDDLFALWGNTFGGADETDFQVPDCRGRALVGQDDMGGVSADRITDAQADILGGVMGTETIDLSHTHGIDKDQDLGNQTWGTAGRLASSYGSGDMSAPQINSDPITESGLSATQSIVQPTMFCNLIVWK